MITRLILFLTAEKNIYSLFDNMNATGLKRVLVLAFFLGGVFFLFFTLLFWYVYLLIKS